MSIKKILTIGALFVCTFPSIMFTSGMHSPSTGIVQSFYSITIPEFNYLSTYKLGSSPEVYYLDTRDNADKALGRVYEQVNRLLSDMVDEMTKAKNTPYWFITR